MHPTARPRPLPGCEVQEPETARTDGFATPLAFRVLSSSSAPYPHGRVSGCDRTKPEFAIVSRRSVVRPPEKNSGRVEKACFAGNSLRVLLVCSIARALGERCPLRSTSMPAQRVNASAVALSLQPRVDPAAWRSIDVGPQPETNSPKSTGMAIAAKMVGWALVAVIIAVCPPAPPRTRCHLEGG